MMKYIVKLTLDGEFPGSPDHNYYLVDEKTWDLIHDLVKKFGRHDTLEEIL